MTQAQAPEWAGLGTPGIHAFPAQNQVGQVDLWTQINASTKFFIDTFVGQVAVAFGGIDIFGWKPFDFLVEWGEQRIADAALAYQRAINAQGSANFANSQIATFLTENIATDVPGGIAVSDTFGTAVAYDLGANYTRRSLDVGAGGFGPNGSGEAVWTKSGGNNRLHLDRRNTPLTTNTQIIRAVISTVPEDPTGAVTPAATFLRGRCNAAQTDDVVLSLGFSTVTIGCRISDAVTVFDTVTVTPSVGDTWLLYLGTEDDEREFIVKQNNVIIWQGIDTGAVSQLGASYRYAGLASQAGAGFGFFTQIAPASLAAWAAADRLPNNT